MHSSHPETTLFPVHRKIVFHQTGSWCQKWLGTTGYIELCFFFFLKKVLAQYNQFSSFAIVKNASECRSLYSILYFFDGKNVDWRIVFLTED